MGAVRFQDQIVLYALMTGNIFISYAHNAMCNIWQGFDTPGRTTTPHVALISAYVVRALGDAIRLPPPVAHDHILVPSSTYYRQLLFVVEGGRYIIRDPHTGLSHTVLLDDEAEEDQAFDMPFHQQQQGHDPAQGWDAQAAWNTFMGRYDTDQQALRARWVVEDERHADYDTRLSDLTEAMGQLSTTADNTYSVASRGLHTMDYYVSAAYEQRHSDPMDIDHPQHQSRVPAPIFYRSGDPSRYPPAAAYQHYQPPPQSDDSIRFDGLMESIFGYPPPYPRHPPR